MQRVGDGAERFLAGGWRRAGRRLPGVRAGRWHAVRGAPCQPRNAAGRLPGRSSRTRIGGRAVVWSVGRAGVSNSNRAQGRRTGARGTAVVVRATERGKPQFDRGQQGKTRYKTSPHGVFLLELGIARTGTPESISGGVYLSSRLYVHRELLIFRKGSAAGVATPSCSNRLPPQFDLTIPSPANSTEARLAFVCFRKGGKMGRHAARVLDPSSPDSDWDRSPLEPNARRGHESLFNRAFATCRQCAGLVGGRSTRRYG